jgi:hypothetical protein
MTLITTDELARGALVLTFGSMAGGAVLAFPGSPIWLVPAVLGMAGASLTVPEVRQEVYKAFPDAQQQIRGLLTAPRRVPGTAPTPQATQVQADQATPTSRQRDPLFATLDEQPHRLIIGHSGGGKTTLLHSMAVDWAARGQRVVVLDPDAAPGQWPGCRSFGHGDDYAGIGQALALVSQEIAKRRTARAEGQRRFTPVHIVIDESQDVIAEVPAALNVIETLARRGRKIGMHATLGVQDKQVKTLGLEGKSDLLRNFQVVDMMKQGDQRVAVVHGSEGKTTMPVPTLRDPDDFITRRAAPDDLLRDLLAQSVTSASGRHGNASSVTVTVPDHPGNGNGNGNGTEGVTSALGRQVTVNVHARADVTPGTTRRSRQRRGTGLDMRARRLRHQEQAATREMEQAYRSAGAAGESFRKAYERIGGSRNKMLAAWQEGRRGGAS